MTHPMIPGDSSRKDRQGPWCDKAGWVQDVIP
jgi:hypothetical protein